MGSEPLARDYAHQPRTSESRAPDGRGPGRPAGGRRTPRRPDTGRHQGDDRGDTASADRSDRAVLAHRMRGDQLTFGAVLARLEEREITAQADTSKERIAELSAQLEEFRRTVAKSWVDTGFKKAVWETGEALSHVDAGSWCRR